MIHGFCHQCQIFVEGERDVCRQCGEKLDIIKIDEPAAADFFAPCASSVPPSVHEQQSFTGSFGHDAALPAGGAPNFAGAQTSTASASWMNSASASYAAAPMPDYSAKYAPKRSPYRAGYQKTSAQTGGNAKKIIACGVLALIAFAGVGFIFSYAKAYFAELPGKRMRETFAGNADPESQTPWFSGWFRKEPTADEIFEKFAEVTGTTGKSLNSTSTLISGEVKMGLPSSQFLTTYQALKISSSPGGRKIDLNNYFSSSVFNFEMSLKAPNKALIKMETSSGNNTIVRIYSGFDGTNKWQIARGYVNGQYKSDEKSKATAASPIGSDKDFLNPTFSRDMYQTVRLIGMETIDRRKHYFVRAVKPNGDSETLYFDIETGLISKHSGPQGEVYIIEYGPIGNVTMPTTLLQKVDNTLVYIKIVDYQGDVPLDDSVFQQTSHQ